MQGLNQGAIIISINKSVTRSLDKCGEVNVGVCKREKNSKSVAGFVTLVLTHGLIL